MIVGHYEYDPQEPALGGGGMGNVHRAVDLRTGQHVALKILHAHLAGSDDAVLRLRREARTASRISHPNIARTLKHGQDGDAYYLAMELVEGESLKRRLRRDRLSEAEALAVGLAVGRALEAAHDAGVVHRDVKPGNVLLPDGDEFDAGAIKLGDFGAASAADATRVTRGPSYVGTPEYSAPEAFDSAVTPQSDLYSLGVTLYEVLAGRLPFRGDFEELRVQHQRRAPDMLPIRRAAPSLLPIIARLLDKKPRRRYARAAELVAALAAIRDPLVDVVPSLPFAGDDGTTLIDAASRPPSAAPRARSRIGVAAAAAFAVSLVGAGALAGSGFFDGGDAPAAKRVSVQPGAAKTRGLGSVDDVSPTENAPGGEGASDTTSRWLPPADDGLPPTPRDIGGPSRSPQGEVAGQEVSPASTPQPADASSPSLPAPTAGFDTPLNEQGAATIAGPGPAVAPPTDSPPSTPTATATTTTTPTATATLATGGGSTQTLAIPSDESWLVEGGPAGLVCLRTTPAPPRPDPCPAGASVYGYTIDAWLADFQSQADGYPSSANRPRWIWMRGINGNSNGANNAQYCFTKTVMVNGTIRGGKVWYAADDFITIKVNGNTVVDNDFGGFGGNNSVRSKEIFLGYLAAGANVIEVCVRNANSPAACADDQYYCNPAGFAFQGAIYYDP